MKMRVAAAAGALLCSALFISAAAAEDGGAITVEGLPVIYVAYDDLNLRSGTGVDRLNRRVDAAAKRVCGLSALNGVQPVSTRGSARACHRTALDGARPQVARAITASDMAAHDRQIVVAARR